MTIRKTQRLLAPFVLSLTFSALLTGPPANAAPTCYGRRATKVGTAKKDQIRGTDRADVIVGLGGADQIDGRGGADLICGGGGADGIFGYDGDDRIDGGGGFDTLFGQSGNDRLKLGNDIINGAVGGEGDDRIVGGNGIDLAAYIDAPGPVDVDLSAGTATGDGRDILVDIDGALGSDYDDTLRGTDGTNFLFGGGGNDSIFTEGNTGSVNAPRTNSADVASGDGDPQAVPGDDTITGGSGVNIVDFSSSGPPVSVNLLLGTATGQGADTLSGMNVVVGTKSNDSLTGDQHENGFAPLEGNDSVDGGIGEDVLIFAASINGVAADLATGSATGEGTDSFSAIENLWGSIGQDTLAGDGGSNKIYGLVGNDGITAAAGDDLLDGGDGIDVLDGGEGTDACASGETITNCEDSAVAVHAARLRGWNRTNLLVHRLFVRLTLAM